MVLRLLVLALALLGACGGSGGPAGPTATGVVPTGGPAAGGTPITITGSGFAAGGVAVALGGAACTGIVVVDDATITCTTPPGVGAAVPLVVTTSRGVAAVPGGFHYVGIAVDVAPLLRVGIGDELRFALTAVDVAGPVSARLLHALPGMHFDPSVNGVTPGAQQCRWTVSRHAGGRHRLDFDVPGTVLTLRLDIRVDGNGDATGTGTLIGDVTGDGIQDVVAGASGADGVAPDSGRIHVFAGGAAPSAAPSAVLFVPGAAAGDALGGDAAAGPLAPGSGQLLQLADVTGDGVLDIVAAAPGADVGVVDRGAIYVWVGGATLTGGVTRAPDATLVAAAVGTAGDRLCGTGDTSQGLLLEDVTGDGIVDIVAVAPFHDLGTVDAGAIFVWPGSPGLVGAGVITAPVVLGATGGVGGAAGARLGRGAVTGPDEGQACQLADVTGDGIADIVAVAKTADGAAAASGVAFVWAGGPGLLTTRVPTATLLDPTAVGGERLGDIGGGGGLHLVDVTGDGTPDVVLGCALLDAAVVDAGGVLVWAGGAGLSGTPAITARCMDPAARPSDRLGFVEASGAAGGPQRGIAVGDVTGDGMADIVACASEADVAAPDSGAVYVFAGGVGLTGTVAPTARCADPAATAGDRMGATWRSGPAVHLVDVTGDGVRDLVVPVPRADVGATDAGVIHVFRGGPALLGAAAPSATLVGSATAGDQLGRVNHPSLMGNGHALQFEDVTGDGIRDVVVACPQADVQATDDGAIRVWIAGPGLVGVRPPASTLAVAGTSFLGAADIFGQGGEGGVQIVDVTGDGLLDITVNDPAGTHLGRVQAGVVHVWAGGAWAPAPAPRASLGGSVAGAALGLGSGHAVVFGDLTQDGVLDVLVAAPDGFGSPPPGGRVYVWSGGAGVVGVPPPAVVLIDPSPPFAGSGIGSNFPYDGLNAQELFVADLTGDGGLDVVGTDARHSRTGVGSGEGAVHLWAGPAPASTPTVSFLDPTASPGDQLGRVR